MDIKINADGTIPIENNDLAKVTELEAIAQNVSIKLQIIKGEYDRDRNEGVDYFGKILKKGYPENLIETEIKNAILSVEGVLGISGFQLSVNSETRAASIIIDKITCKEGVFPFEVTI